MHSQLYIFLWGGGGGGGVGGGGCHSGRLAVIVQLAFRIHRSHIVVKNIHCS